MPSLPAKAQQLLFLWGTTGQRYYATVDPVCQATVPTALFLAPAMVLEMYFLTD